jgi:serralysin
VRVLDGATGAELRSFFAYAPAFNGGVNVAYGDGWIVTGAGPGAGPHVRAFDATTGAEVRSFYAYDPGFTGGVSVAVGDINHISWRPDPAILTGAGAGGNTNVRMFDGTTGDRVQDWVAFPGGSGAVSVMLAELSRDGYLESVVASGAGDPPRVRVFAAATATEQYAFAPYPDSYRDGVFVG